MDRRMRKLDENLKKLLNSAYERPEFREEFRCELLAKLKDSQRLRTVQRRRRNARVIFLLGTASGIAAALLLLAIGPDLLGVGVSRPANSGSGTSARWVSTSPAPAAVASRPSPLPVPTLPEKEEEVRDLLASNPTPAGGHVRATTRGSDRNAYALAPPAIPAAGESASVKDLVEIRTGDSRTWQRLDDKSTFNVTPGTEIRTLPGSGKPTGLWLDPATKLVLLPNTNLRYESGRIDLRRGTAMLSLEQTASALTLKVREHTLRIDPGSEVFLKVRGGEKFAAGGAPAPQVALLKGTASISTESGPRPLRPCKLYCLYATTTGQFPSREFCNLEQRRMRPQRLRFPSPPLSPRPRRHHAALVDWDR